GLVVDGVGERELERVQELDGRLAHRNDQLRLHDVQLAREERARLVLAAVCELEAVRAVDRHRVDVQGLQRLENRLSRPPVEGDALLNLRRLRPVLEQHHVGERVARADDRHAVPARPRDLVGKLVALDDRLLQVLLVDLVGRWHRPRTFLLYRTRSLAWAIHLSDWRYTSERGRRPTLAERRL